VTYLVDANVLSEATKPAPDARVVEWLRRNEREIAVDPIILGEIRFGIHLLPGGRRRQRLERWFSEGVAKIVCLSWEAATGLRWAKLLADLRTSPCPASFDSASVVVGSATRAPCGRPLDPPRSVELRTAGPSRAE